MLSKLKQNSEFNKNILTLMTGTTIAQAIPIAFSPILTRIYTPEDFGVLALFISISLIFGSIINARYELAIMLPKNDDDAMNILALGFLICISLSCFLLLLVILLNDYIAYIFKNKDLIPWLYFIPVSVFLIGTFNLLNYFNNRKKYYKDISNAIIIKSIVLVLVQLTFIFFKNGPFGLIMGEVFSRGFANLKLVKNVIKNQTLKTKISRIKIIEQAKKYKEFPKFSMWASLAQSLSLHFSNVLISVLFSITTLGFYSLVQKVLDLPLSLIGTSISQVFFQKATDEKQKNGNSLNTFNSTLKKLFFIALPSFLLLFFVIEDLFVFVFSEEWRIAGIYAKILLPLFCVKFIVSTFTLIPIIYGKVKIDLYFQVILFLLYFLIFYIGFLLDASFTIILYFITIIISIYYLGYFLICRKYAFTSQIN